MPVLMDVVSVGTRQFGHMLAMRCIEGHATASAQVARLRAIAKVSTPGRKHLITLVADRMELTDTPAPIRRSSPSAMQRDIDAMREFVALAERGGQ